MVCVFLFVVNVRNLVIIREVGLMRLIISLFFVLSLPLHACWEPSSSPPSCTSSYGANKFETTQAYERCKDDIEEYIEKLRDWASCVGDEARERSEKAIKKFNCKVSGESYCW